MATSASTETAFANLYSQEMRIGSITIKNRYLEKVLDRYGKNTKETWDKIADDGGSVKNLAFLTDREREVYKTAMEIDQFWNVEHYATRQPFICQAQSFNMYLGPATDINYAVGVHIYAWKRGLKSIYYYRTETGAKVERVSTKVEQDRIEEVKRTIIYGTPTCTQCKAAKSLLEANGIEYEYVDLVSLGKTAAEVTGRPVRSVPQVYIESQYIGGLTELMTYLNQKKESSGGETCVACEA